MNGLNGLKQDGQMEELLGLLEEMQTEADRSRETIRQKDSEIRILQEQLRESLNLCEKLNSENRAGNVQALQSGLKQTRELLQSEKEKLQNANLTIKDYQDKLYRAEKEKEFAITHQKKVEIPVEKPVLYEKCRSCERKAYQQAKERYEHQRKGLEKKYKAKAVRLDAMIVVLWWYAVVTTVFAAIYSETAPKDFILFIRAIWKSVCQLSKSLLFAGQYVAQVSERMSNEMAATIVYWLLLITVVVGLAGSAGMFLVIIAKKVIKMYQENCWDVVSAIVTVTSVAIAVYFGDGIKSVIKCNLAVILLLVQAVYVGIRVYVNGCKRARGYY